MIDFVQNVCLSVFVSEYKRVCMKQPKQTNFAVHESPYDTVIPFMT